jgi:hypothetical protein
VAAVAQIASDLQTIIPSKIDGLDVSYYVETATSERPTPLGCTHLWGSAMQDVEILTRHDAGQD